MFRKTFIIISLTLVTTIASADIAHVSGESILVYSKLNRTQLTSSKDQFIRSNILPMFGALQKKEFSNAQINFLLENSHNGLRTFMGNLVRSHFMTSLILTLYGQPSPEYYRQPLFNPAVDFLVKIDLVENLNAAQISVLGNVRSILQHIGTVSISKTTNYLFYSTNQESTSDVSIGFINRWAPQAGSRISNDKYWLERHGPLAVSLGMPKELVTYSQLHTDFKQPDGLVFDTNYQGMSFETITNEKALLRMSLRPSVIKMNARLILDEQNFTASPRFLIFQKINLN